MDYGHRSNQLTEVSAIPSPEPDFFTAGVGNASPDTNVSGPSLNSEAISDVGQAQRYSARGLTEVTTEYEGAKPVTTGLSDPSRGQMYPELASDSLGIIRPTDPTPDRPTPTADLSNLLSQVRPQGDHLSDAGVHAMDNITHHFNDSVSDSYEQVNAARTAYLKELGLMEDS